MSLVVPADSLFLLLMALCFRRRSIRPPQVLITVRDVSMSAPE
ncbi:MULTISPECIES: hypothetical protein [unclassified Micromonospora]